MNAEPRVEKIEELMLAALQAMSPISEQCTAEEVINAMLNLAGRAVDITVRIGGNTESVRSYLHMQLLKVVPLSQRH